jgi:hypothetical protein
MKVGELPGETLSSQIDEALVAWLKGKRSGLSLSALGQSADDLMHRIDFHGVAGLLSDALASDEEIPNSIKDSIRHRAISHAFWEAQHARLLAEALTELTRAGLSPLLFKGSALAYSHYPRAAGRIRSDSDVLVGEAEFAPACEVLTRLGFKSPLTAGGDVASAEKSFIFVEDTGTTHDIDLHRKFSNSPVLARIFPHALLLERSRSLPKLGTGARRPDDVDCLLIAAVHRLVHNQAPYYVDGVGYLSADRMIWLKDIELLTAGFSAEDWGLLESRASELKLTEILASGLKAAAHVFDIQVPREILCILDRAEAASGATRYLSAGPAERFFMDLVATPGLSKKLGYLRDVFFPSAEYVRSKYPDEPTASAGLAKLYLKRMVGGLRKSRMDSSRS